MAGKKQPYGINNIVSWGATIVIIGLLFKIQHWPYGGFFISLGLGTEALLFGILGFQRDTSEIDWTRAYPELSEDYKGELPASSSNGTISIGGGNFSETSALDKMMADAKIGPELISSLGEGLRNFGDKVNAISRVTDAGNATIAFTEKVNKASESYDKLTVSFDKASANLADFAGSGEDSKTYHAQVATMAKSLTALNAVYELELQNSSNHLKSMNKFYSDMELTLQNFTESVDGSQQFKTEVSKLSKSLASLNAVYGNMLSAMNQPRA
ncbi:type IX secretion system motor protein PorL/GldL [Mucilaginibacter sp.]